MPCLLGMSYPGRLDPKVYRPLDTSLYRFLGNSETWSQGPKSPSPMANLPSTCRGDPRTSGPRSHVEQRSSPSKKQCNTAPTSRGEWVPSRLGILLPWRQAPSISWTSSRRGGAGILKAQPTKDPGSKSDKSPRPPGNPATQTPGCVGSLGYRPQGNWNARPCGCQGRLGVLGPGRLIKQVARWTLVIEPTCRVGGKPVQVPWDQGFKLPVLPRSQLVLATWRLGAWVP